MMKNEYRIVNDRFAGYEVQTKKWWFPFWWWQCHDNGLINTHRTLESAETFAQRHSMGICKPKPEPKFIKYLGRLPSE